MRQHPVKILSTNTTQNISARIGNMAFIVYTTLLTTRLLLAVALESWKQALLRMAYAPNVGYILIADTISLRLH